MLIGGDRLNRILSELAEKSGKSATVSVGFHDTEKYEDGTYVAQVAFWNEYGTSKIPSRPFFRHVIETKSESWADAVALIAPTVDYDIIKTLSLVGEGIRDQIVKSIVDWQIPPNAPSTIKKKGFNKPLIDTGAMQRAVGYKVEA